MNRIGTNGDGHHQGAIDTSYHMRRYFPFLVSLGSHSRVALGRHSATHEELRFTNLL